MSIFVNYKEWKHNDDDDDDERKIILGCYAHTTTIERRSDEISAGVKTSQLS
jgi:hypothetical protein